MNSPIVICLASDDNYAPYLGICILSILKAAASGDEFKFYILDNGISAKSMAELETLKNYHSFEINFVKIDTSCFKDFVLKETRLTKAIFGRYFIPNIVPEDKVLYLDCDIMVRHSLSELWNIELGANYVAGTLDYHVMKNTKMGALFGGKLNIAEYINSGVLLINNKKCREDNLPQLMLKLTKENENDLQFPDQDIINFACQGKKKIISHSWNVMGFLYKPDLFIARKDYKQIISQRKDCRIRHFQPWRKNWFMPHRSEYLSLLAQSPWKDKIPQDDNEKYVLIKNIAAYIWKHPFCLFSLSFYKKWKMRGTECLFNGW